MGALIIAAQFDIPEVCLCVTRRRRPRLLPLPHTRGCSYFNHKLFRGNRVTKMDASDLEAFASNNFPPLVQVGIDFKVEWERVLSPPSGPFAVDTRFNPNVAIIRFYPGLSGVWSCRRGGVLLLASRMRASARSHDHAAAAAASDCGSHSADVWRGKCARFG